MCGGASRDRIMMIGEASPDRIVMIWEKSREGDLIFGEASRDRIVVSFFDIDFFVQKQHKTYTVNSWVHWQTWKRHWGILAVQKHHVTEQTNKTRHSTIAMRQNLISDDFSLDLILLANHANVPTYIGNLLMLWRLPYNIQQMSVLKKEFHPNSTAVRMHFQHLILTLDVRG